MKEGIHPKYVEATVECACGNVITTKSTRGSFKIDICSKCHPFFSGKQKLLDSAGRVDRFRKKYGLKDTGEIPAPAQAPVAPEAKPEAKTDAKADAKTDAKKG
jgi:large subunit ribosomal protein L31